MAFKFVEGGDAGHIDALIGCKTKVRIHFVDGSSVTGRIANHNEDVIIFYSDNEETEMLYKRAIMRIVTLKK